MSCKSYEAAFEELPAEEKINIAQVAATLAIENMPMSESDLQDLIDYANGKITVDDIIQHALLEADQSA